jgi:eukaryotic-like serine/threonine-protein kinase
VEKRLMSASQARTARQTAADTRRIRSSAVPAPLVLGRYRLLRRLGAGAFGTVWMARDERLERDVAVKILLRERVVGGRFEREARAAARLAHPGIVTLYEASVDDQGAYLVSELVRGSTLAELLDAGRLSDQDIVSIGVALCDALEHAHAEGVVHRDVKPSNVLVPERPATPGQLAKLTDFGVARVVGGDSLTHTGDVIGTLAYMAPEQAEGLEAGGPADLYSLAVILYEALTGINPVRCATASQRARRLGAYLPPLRRQRRDLPRALGQGIDQALRPRPRERGRISDLRQALVATLEQVDDEPGIVAAPLTSREALSDSKPVAFGESVSGARRRADDAEQLDSGSPDQVWPARALAGVAAAATAGWLTANPLAPAPLPAAAAALLAGALTLILPRVGWLALSAAACAIAISQHHAGFALLALIALLVPVLLLARRPTAWPLAAGAPALGLVGAAGAWPALAARAPTAWRRAALGATGWIWVLLAAPVAGRVLYLTRGRIPGGDAWRSSPHDTAHQVLAPLLGSGAMAPAAVWALGAIVLPWLVRGRSAALDIVRVVFWSVTLVAASTAAVAVLRGPSAPDAAPSAVLGAVVGAFVALVPSWLRPSGLPWRPAGQSPGPGA